MASAGIISHLHFSANLFIEPNLNAVGALVKTMFETGLPAIIYEELTGDEYRPVDGIRHIK